MRENSHKSYRNQADLNEVNWDVIYVTLKSLHTESVGGVWVEPQDVR